MLPRSNLLSRIFVVIITVTLLLATLGIGLGADYFIKARAQTAFGYELENIAKNINTRLISYKRLIDSYTTYLKLDDNVTISDQNNFVTGINMPVQYPGVTAVSIIQLDQDRNNFLLESIAPDTTDNYSLFRLDLSKSPECYKLMLTALEQDKFLATKEFEMPGNIGKGFLVVRKLDENRLTALIFRSQDLYRTLLEETFNQPELSAALVDKGSQKILFESQAPINPYLSGDIPIEFAQLEWQLKAEADSNYKRAQYSQYVPVLLTAVVGVASLVITTYLREVTKSNQDNEILAKETATRAEKLETQLQTIMDNTSVVVYIKDINGVYQLINDQFAKLVGKTKSEVVGKTDFDVFPAKTAAKLLENERKVINKGEEMQFEEKFENPSTLEVEFYASQKFPLADENGEVYAVGTISTNVTRQKEDTQKLEQRKSELERINQIMVDRELKMIELKNKIKELQLQVNE